MPAYVKCQFCGGTTPAKEKGTLHREGKVSPSTGKEKSLYFHHECYPKELEKREFARKESEEKDKFDRLVRKIYGIQYSPSDWFWQIIEDLRNGTNRYQKFWEKRYKAGVPYSVMYEAMLLAKSKIEWAKLNQFQFRTLEGEMRWGLKQMASFINEAHRKMKVREQQEKVNKAIEQAQIESMKEERNVEFRRSDKKKDYSALLGD